MLVLSYPPYLSNLFFVEPKQLRLALIVGDVETQTGLNLMSAPFSDKTPPCVSESDFPITLSSLGIQRSIASVGYLVI